MAFFSSVTTSSFWLLFSIFVKFSLLPLLNSKSKSETFFSCITLQSDERGMVLGGERVVRGRVCDVMEVPNGCEPRRYRERDGGTYWPYGKEKCGEDLMKRKMGVLVCEGLI
eukprot:TRINITY_DN31457_c0_g2_i1.p1 TRINITY_DN31457_c0_g2~~TRINITY_DN31457_c0_g2_i1.p1  ORF type:complete len:112 (+),score=24.05 TRINITY_DN31457_c0_g2_i1:115-450(+)